jgi:hypothetical protein
MGVGLGAEVSAPPPAAAQPHTDAAMDGIKGQIPASICPARPAASTSAHDGVEPSVGFCNIPSLWRKRED